MLCSGCVIKYRDVSDRPEYQPLVGTTYTLTNAMYIAGVNAPPGYEKTIDFYLISPLNHNWGGPEKITEETLPSGTKLTVKRIQKPLSYFLGDPIQSEVEVTPYKPGEPHPVYISLKDLKCSGNTSTNKPVQPEK